MMKQASVTIGRRVPAVVGASAATIDTPALVIDLDAMERNLGKMQAFATRSGVKLRPHAKMHKSAAIAKMQIEAGAVGVCVQKTSEAEALFAEGIRDIYISNEVINAAKLRRVAALAACGASIAICVDSTVGVERLVAALRNATVDAEQPRSARPRVRVLIEIDVGHGRCGAPLSQVAVLAKAIVAASDVLDFGGMQAYHGSAQHFRAWEARRAAVDAAVAVALDAARIIKDAVGVDVPLVTGAGTGTFPLEAASGVYGELQAGSYLFMDRDYCDNSLPQSDDVPKFENALFVLTEVMSAAQDGRRAVCDAGHKAHAIDSGLPRVHGRPDVAFENGGDEHGKLAVSPGAIDPGFVLGDRLLLVPGHCDPTVNLHDFLVGVRGDVLSGAGIVERIFTVTARGCTT